MSRVNAGNSLAMTYSAEPGPFLEMVLASTTKATTFAVARCSSNCPRNLGCPGISMTLKDLLSDKVTAAVLFCIDVCVGKVCLKANFEKKSIHMETHIHCRWYVPVIELLFSQHLEDLQGANCHLFSTLSG